MILGISFRPKYFRKIRSVAVQEPHPVNLLETSISKHLSFNFICCRMKNSCFPCSFENTLGISLKLCMEVVQLIVIETPETKKLDDIIPIWSNQNMETYYQLKKTSAFFEFFGKII